VRSHAPSGRGDRGRPTSSAGWPHGALLHAGEDDLVETACDFALAGLAADEPVVVLLRPGHAEAVRQALDDDAEYVVFVDAADRLRNPSRLVSTWSDLTVEHRRPGRRVRGVGEVTWKGRRPDELVECRHHEGVLNAAAPEGLTLLCAHDTATLPDDVVAAAHLTHPFVVRDGVTELSGAYAPLAEARLLTDPLPEPPVPCDELAFGADDVTVVVWPFVNDNGRDAGLDAPRRRELVVAVGEAVMNSVVHGGGSGVVRCWFDEDALVHEVRDAGVVDDVLAGYRRPNDGDGWGLWLIHELCDLVQVRSSPDGGTVVRMHVRC
jgi:anti-sigma regulatory factor (Ser/Thr protein kinase)